MLGLAVCLSTAGIYQRFVIYPQDRALYEKEPEAAVRAAGVSAGEGTAQRKQFEDRLYSNEPTATFSLTNSLAGYLAPWLVILLGIATQVRRPSKAVESGSKKVSTSLEGRRTQGAVLIGMMLIGFCLLLTQSRTAWLATGLGCAAVCFIVTIRWSTRRHLLLAAGSLLLFAAMLAALLASGILEIEILTQAALSLKYRFEYWQSTLAMIFDHPLLGCGPGNFQQYYTSYKLPEASETVADPHNFLLEIAATAGLPALALLLWLLALAVKGSGVFFFGSVQEPVSEKEEKKTPDPLTYVYAGGVVGVVLSILLGVITGYLPTIAATLLGAAAGVGAVWLLHDWVLRGELPGWLILLGIAVLLVNLLAAGGIGFPGVAITLWVLIAISCPAPSAKDSPRPSRPLAVAGAFAAASLLAACYHTAYRPVLESGGHLAQAAYELRQLNVNSAIAEYNAALQSDPLSPDAHQQLASLYFHRWISQPQPTTSDADYTLFQQHAQAALQLDKRAYQRHTAIGYLDLQAFARTGDMASGKSALSQFQAAARLDPADALTHAQLAWAAAFLGPAAGVDVAEEAAKEAAEALRLDALCPHSERKLAQRKLFAEFAPRESENGPLADTREKSAELWMREIRSKEDAQ